MTTDRQRLILKEGLSGYYGPKFEVHADRDEIYVSFQILGDRTPRYATAGTRLNLDGRKPVTDDNLDTIKKDIRKVFIMGMNDPRFTEQARGDYARAHKALEHLK